jgi:hypothetical protein
MLLDLDDIPAWLDRHKYEPTAFGAAKSVPLAQP